MDSDKTTFVGLKESLENRKFPGLRVRRQDARTPQNTWNIKKYWERRKKSICVSCGKVKVEEPRVRCPECIEKKKKSYDKFKRRKWYENQKARNAR